MYREEYLDEDVKWKDWRSTNILVYDCESTGIDPLEARICQFSAKLITIGDKGVIDQAKPVNFYINCEVEIPEEASNIHQVWEKDRLSFPTLTEDIEGEDFAPIDSIMSLWDQADIICGYNILNYDNILIEEELKRRGEKLYPKPSLDLIVWYRAYTQRFSKSKLSDACKKFGVSYMAQVAYGKLDLHDSKVDVDSTAELCYQMSRKAITAHCVRDLVTMQNERYVKQEEYRLKKYGSKK